MNEARSNSCIVRKAFVVVQLCANVIIVFYMTGVRPLVSMLLVLCFKTQAAANSLFPPLRTAGFFGSLGLFVVCFGAGGGLRLPGMNSKIVRSLSYMPFRCAKA